LSLAGQAAFVHRETTSPSGRKAAEALRARGGKDERRRVRGAPFLHHLEDVGDHVPRPLQDHGVSLADVQSLDLVGIVKGGPADRGPGDLHGVQQGRGGEGPGPPDAHQDLPDHRGGLLGRELVRHGPAGVMGGRAQTALLVQGIHFDHHAVGVVPEGCPVPLQLGAGGDDRLDVRAAPRAGVHLEARLAQGPQCLPVGGEGVRLRVAQRVDEDVQAALCRDAGVLLAQRPGRGVSRVGEGFLPLGLQRPVQLLERLAAHEDLSPDLQDVQGCRLPAKAQGDRGHRLQVLGDILAQPPVAAGGAPNEPALLVQQGDAQAVHLGLADVGEGFAGEGPLQARLEFPDLLGGVGVVQAEHGHPVLDRGEAFGHGAADALGGGVWGGELRVGRLQLLELVEQAVILRVGDLRPGQDVVAVAVVVQERAKLLGPGGGILFLGGHSGIPCVPCNRIPLP